MTATDPRQLSAAYRRLVTENRVDSEDLPRSLADFEVELLLVRYRRCFTEHTIAGVEPVEAAARADAQLGVQVRRLADFLRAVADRRRHWARVIAAENRAPDAAPGELPRATNPGTHREVDFALRQGP